MKRAVILLAAFFLITSYASVAQAQTGSISRNERAMIEQELTSEISRDRNEQVRVRVNDADSTYGASNEVIIRGQATVTGRRVNSEDVWFNAILDRRRSRVIGLDWGYGRDNRGGYNPRDDRGDYGRSSSGVIRDGRYEIQLVATGRMLDIGAGSQLAQRAGNGSRSQQWDIEDAGGGFYYVRSAETGELWTVAGNGGSGSSVLLARASRSRDDQQWEIVQGPDNGYYFISRQGKALDSPSSARFDGGRMQVYNRNGEANQRFLLRSVRDFDRGRYDDWRDRRDDRRDRRDDRFDDRYQSGPGYLNWRGRVDDIVEIEIRGGRVRETVISGQPIYDARSSFSSSLPNREVRVTVEKLRGRGRVEIIEQPSRQNRYTAVIRISDTQGGASDYEIRVSWN